MKKLLLTFLLLCSFVTFNANAGVYIEPYLNVLDNSTLDFGGSTGEVDLNGMSFGARIGYKMPAFWFALDFETGGSKELENDAGDTVDYSQTNTGLAVGFTLVPMLTLYAKYLISAKADIGWTAGDAEYTGGGTAFGLGWSPVPMLNVNIEYRNIVFDEVDGESLNDDVTNGGLVVGISVPFSL